MSTPPTMAHVLIRDMLGASNRWMGRHGRYARGEEVRERLPRLNMTDQERRDLVVEECAGNAAVAVGDVETSRRVLHRTLVEVTLEVRRAVLVRADLHRITPSLRTSRVAPAS